MEQLKIYTSPHDFWAEVSPQLRKEEAKNNLVLGLSSGFRQDPTLCVYQSALLADEKLLGAVVGSHYQGYINFLPTPVENAECAEKLFSTFQKKNIKIHNVIGELNTVKTYRGFFEKTGLQFKIKMAQGIYRCTKVTVPKSSPDLKLRRAEMKDQPLVKAWIEAFYNEAVPHDPKVDFEKMAESKIEGAWVYLLENSAEVVSMAGWGRNIETSCTVNLVYTPQAWRGQGYGSLVTALLTQHHLTNGKSETNLYTDISNPTSNKIYQAIGYEFVCDSIHLGVLTPP